MYAFFMTLQLVECINFCTLCVCEREWGGIFPALNPLFNPYAMYPELALQKNMENISSKYDKPSQSEKLLRVELSAVASKGDFYH